jgi:murein DD-endopeptidase MepM/ murein hydrolase activator NlpD
MKYIKILVLFIVIFVKLNDANSGIGKDAYTAGINNYGLEDIENAIIIKGLEPGSDNFLNYSDNNQEGAIIYNDLIDDKILKDKSVKKDKFINILRKQDNKWHLTLYKIKRNENLWSIAKKFEIDYKIILKSNNINIPNLLNPGKTILIPNRKGIEHRVQKNETIGELSKKYKVSKTLIVSQNYIKKNIIKEGDLLFIPDAAPLPVKFAKHNNRDIKINEDNPGNEAGNTGVENTNISENAGKNITAKVNEKSRPSFSWPLNGSITSAFGKRVDPINNRAKFHCGMDIGAEIGTPVKAAADGEAIFSGWKKGYGRVVILKHKDGYITVYAHNKENIVLSGNKVQKGEVIASSGMSGAVTGPHLHFEIRKYVAPLNPYRFLK